MRVIDNFLPDYQFKLLSSIILGDEFSWYWNDKILEPEDKYYNPKDYQFTHTFFDRDPPVNGESSIYYELIKNSSIFSLLGVNQLYKIKANLNPRTFFKRFHGWHSDYPAKNGFEPGKTAILYINTNNGYTKFKKGGKVKSVANRMVIFDPHIQHAGYTCTDEKMRVVVNFNYV